LSLSFLMLEDDIFSAVLIGVLGLDNPLGETSVELTVVSADNVNALEHLSRAIPFESTCSRLRSLHCHVLFSLKSDRFLEVPLVEGDEVTVGEGLWLLLGEDDELDGNVSGLIFVLEFV